MNHEKRLQEDEESQNESYFTGAFVAYHEDYQYDFNTLHALAGMYEQILALVDTGASCSLAGLEWLYILENALK